MRDTTGFSLRVEPSPGADIQKLCAEAIHLAHRVCTNVVFEANGVTVIAKCDQRDERSLWGQWNAEVTSSHSHKIIAGGQP